MKLTKKKINHILNFFDKYFNLKKKMSCKCDHNTDNLSVNLVNH